MTEHEQRRLVNHRLGVLQHAAEGTGNVAQTCRYYGISRQTFYKWLRRFEEQGLDGLRDRSSRPHRSPNATDAEVVGKIMYLRQHYHFGPHKIAMYLKRYHDVSISPSGVWRILARLDLNRLPSSQRHKSHQKRWQRYEKPQPGVRVQVDVRAAVPSACSTGISQNHAGIHDARLHAAVDGCRLDDKAVLLFEILEPRNDCIEGGAFEPHPDSTGTARLRAGEGAAQTGGACTLIHDDHERLSRGSLRATRSCRMQLTRYAAHPLQILTLLFDPLLRTAGRSVEWQHSGTEHQQYRHTDPAPCHHAAFAFREAREPALKLLHELVDHDGSCPRIWMRPSTPSAR